MESAEGSGRDALLKLRWLVGATRHLSVHLAARSLANVQAYPALKPWRCCHCQRRLWVYHRRSWAQKGTRPPRYHEIWFLTALRYRSCSLTSPARPFKAARRFGRPRTGTSWGEEATHRPAGVRELALAPDVPAVLAKVARGYGSRTWQSGGRCSTTSYRHLHHDSLRGTEQLLPWAGEWEGCPPPINEAEVKG